MALSLDTIINCFIFYDVRVLIFIFFICVAVTAAPATTTITTTTTTINTNTVTAARTRWFKYDRDDLCVNKSQFVPVIFEPPCKLHIKSEKPMARKHTSKNIRTTAAVAAVVVVIVTNLKQK